MLNQICGLVQTGRYLFNIFCDDKFVQSEADRRLLRKLDDEEVEIVVFVHVDDIRAHAQTTMERFVTELGKKLKVKSTGEKFSIEKTSRAPASSGALTLSPRG